jgi:hypothetical protein
VVNIFPLLTYAQATVTPDTQVIEKAKVTGVTGQKTKIIPGTETS